jgi:hypothetical protein
MLVSLGLCLPSATTSDVTLFGTVVVVLNNVILSTPIVCIVLVIINKGNLAFISVRLNYGFAERW